MAVAVSALLGGAIDFGLQYFYENKSFDCINWSSVGISAAIGGISGGILEGAAPFISRGAGVLRNRGLLNAGKQIDKGALTKTGRALEKHGSRHGSVFPRATGNPASKNAQGQEILKEILNSKNQTITKNRFGGKDIFDTSTGRGVRFDKNRNMMGFLEP